MSESESPRLNRVLNVGAGQIKALKWAKSRFSLAFGANKIFCYSFLMNTVSLFADPNLLQLESEAMINTDDAPSQRSA